MLFAPALLVSLLLPAPQSDWPHLRGPRLDGSAETRGTPGGVPELRVAWRTALGPSYAGVVVGDGLALTTASVGGVDLVVALDALSGAERWRHELEPAYLGHDGSEDGPISTPTLGGGRAFAISARGRLVALALADGKLQWSKDLPAELGTVPPEYGFGSTPLLEGGHLIVQAGGPDGRHLCALDPASGALRWAAGEAPLAYGSPVAMDLAGRRQVVVLAGKTIFAVAPESGELLWSHAFADERDSAENGVATAIDGERFFANVSGTIVVFGVTRSAAGLDVSERVRVKELGRSYAAPVFAEGRLWGFRSDFLTCCDATSGARLWKSRPPGGRGLIRVGEHLVVYGAQGRLALVDTDEGDYRELAGAAVLESSGYAWPAFADGHVYLRNSAELACVELAWVEPSAARATLAAGSTSTAPASAASSGAFGAFLGALEGAADPAALVQTFLAEHPVFPLQEPGQIHFLYQGEAGDVAIAGSMLDGRPLPLARIQGTDLWHRSFAIEPGARWEYRFQVDFGDGQSDRRNPRTVPGAFGPPVSEVLTPGYQEYTHFRPFLPLEGAARGRLETLAFESASLGKRQLQVFLPADYEGGSGTQPLLLVHQGPEWIEKGGLANTLDNYPPRDAPIAVFIPPIADWWHEGGGTGTEAYLDALADELVPFLEARYRLAAGPENRALFGKESFALTAALGVLQRPETFGKAGVLSVALGDRARHTLFALLEGERRGSPTFFVGWNRYEARNRDQGHDYRVESQRLADALRARGYSVAGGERLDAHGWGSWRARTAELLMALFPLE